jgi:hypothetical protein
LRNNEELEKAEAEMLDRGKFENWSHIKSAVRAQVSNIVGLHVEEIPSRSMFLRKSEFPASTVSAAISLDGQRLDLHWVVRERIGGVVEEESDAFQVKLNEDGRLYFTRKNESFTLQDVSRLIVSLATKF